MAGAFRRDEVRRPIRDAIERKRRSGELLPEQAERLAAAEQRGHDQLAALRDGARALGLALLVGALAVAFLAIVARAGAEPVEPRACRWCPDLQCLSSSVCAGCVCLKVGSETFGRCASFSAR